MLVWLQASCALRARSTAWLTSTGEATGSSQIFSSVAGLRMIIESGLTIISHGKSRLFLRMGKRETVAINLALNHRLAAAEIHRLPSDAAGGIRSDVGHELGDFIGVEEALYRHRSGSLGSELFRRDAQMSGRFVDPKRCHFGVHPAGANGVDGDTAADYFQSQRAGKSDHAMLGCAVSAIARYAEFTEHR